MHLIISLALLYLGFRVYQTIYGRFGTRSRFKLWRKFKDGYVTVYVVTPRNPLELRGNICPATFYPKLRLGFADELSMKYLAGLNLPSGIDIASIISRGEVMALHFYAKGKCQVEKRQGTIFLKHEMYALVDAAYSKNHKVITNGNMIATI